MTFLRQDKILQALTKKCTCLPHSKACRR